MSGIDLLIKKLLENDKFKKGMEFYFFFSSALQFFLVEENYNQFFVNLSNKERISQLKNLLLKANELLFNSNAEHADFIKTVFNSETDIGNMSSLVLTLMAMIQSESRERGKIPGSQKKQFVIDSIEGLLRFTELSENNKEIAMASVSTLIDGYVLVKNGALNHVLPPKCKDKLKKCSCW